MISVECHVLLIWWILSLQFISISFHIISCLHLLSCVMRKLGHMVTPFHHGTSFCAVAWVRALAAKSSAAAASLLEGGSTPRLATKKRPKRRKNEDQNVRKTSTKTFWSKKLRRRAKTTPPLSAAACESESSLWRSRSNML